MPVISRAFVVGLAAILVTGCVQRDRGASLELRLPSRWSNGPTLFAAATFTRGNWWSGYGDPEVNRLVENALTANPSLEEAFERVVAARAIARAQGAQRLPSIDASANGTLQSRLSGSPRGLNAAGEDVFGDPPRRTVGTFLAGFDARWELDFFGRVRNTALAAEFAAIVTAEELADAKFTLTAEVVRTYLELRGAQSRLAVIQREVAARRQLLDSVRTQQAAGTSSEFDVQRARSTYEAARARTPAAELAVRVALQRLATLSGVGVSDERLLRGSRAPSTLSIASGPLPTSILRWRADIRRAEVLVAQRAAEADVAEADLYPRFALAGTLDVAGNLLGRPILGTPVTFTGGPAVTIPLVDWGARRQVLKAREAQWREALASYRGTVLRALEDVEISLASVRTSKVRVDRQSTAVTAARRALELADRQYKGGLTGLTERLQAETDLRQAELDLADARESAAIASVSLVKALGTPPTIAVRSQAAAATGPTHAN